MKRFLQRFSILVVLIPLAACTTVGVQEQSMLARNEYGDLIKHVRANYSYDTVDIGTLDALCQAYFETRDYKNFNECSEILIAKAPKEGIRRTTTKKRKTGVWVGGIVGGMADSYMTEFFSHEDIISPMLSKRAMVHLDFEEYQPAIEKSDRAIDLLSRAKTQHPDFLLEAYGVNGLAHALKGNRKKAESRMADLRALDIENVDSDLLRQTALIRIHIALKEYDKARTVMTADTSSGWLKFINKIDYGWNMTSRQLKNIEIPNRFMTGKIFFETGEWSQAGRIYDELLGDTQFRNIGSACIAALSDRGTIAERNGEAARAAELFRQAIDIIEFQRSTISSEASKIGFVGDKQAVYHRMISLLFREGKYEQAFEFVERSKSRALVDLLATKKDFAARSGNAEEIRSMLARQTEAESRTETAETLPALAKNDSRTRSIQITTRDYLNTRAPELASLVTVSSPSFSEIKALIPREDVLVEYYYRDRDAYAFVLTYEGLKGVRLDGSRLLEDVQEYRKLLETAKSTRHRDLAQRLYARLFGPIESVIRTKNLTIVPHGAIHYIPLNALHDGKEYLIDRYSLRVMPSASAIKYLQEKQPGKLDGVLAFGNPDLGNPDHDLAFAQNEAREVAGTRKHSKVLLRKEATEEALRKFGGSYAYIHFATHGLFDPDKPLKSALFLAPDANHDGILTADKLYSLRLNANLITLSACETGLGRIANGDDLVGLARGFLYAGTSAIVSSLWKVDDLSTAELMTRFYRGLEQTGTRDALRAAQLETRKKYPHPYHWAAFQLTGSAK